MHWQKSNRRRPTKRSIFVLFLFVVWVSGSSVCAPLANQNKRGLTVSTIEATLKLPDEHIDIATAVLILSRQWSAPKTLHVYRAKIDDMAREILSQIQQNRLPVDATCLPIINQYLFENLHFSAVANADNPDDLFLHTVLERKRGYCLSLSMLYLAIGERLGLPLYGVVVPGHFFVRYDDGKRTVNIETTSIGALVDDAYYFEKFKPPKQPNTLYMKNLTPKQTLGCFFNNLSNSFNRIGDADSAFHAAQTAVTLAPQLAEAHINLGNLWLKRNQPQKAVDAYQRARQQLGQDPLILNNLASAYLAFNDIMQAENLVREALSIKSDLAEAYQTLALIYQRRNDLPAALQAIQTALSLKSNNVIAHLIQARLLAQAEKYADARLAYLKALEKSATSPEKVDTLLGLAQLELVCGRPDLALDWINKAINITPDQAEAYLVAANAYEKLGDTDKQVDACQIAVRLSDQSAKAWAHLAMALFNAKQIQPAIDAFQKAIQLEPTNAAILYNLAVAYSAAKQWKNAAETFEKTILLDETNPAIYNGLAIAYYYLKNYQKSRLYALKAKELGYPVDPVLFKQK